MIKIQQPSSEMEFMAKSPLIKESQILEYMDSIMNLSDLDVKKLVKDVNKLLQFYNRIITSMSKNLNKLNKHKSTNIDDSLSKGINKNAMLKELSQAKKERTRFRKYLNEIKNKRGIK